jgi:hypothetical protein
MPSPYSNEDYDHSKPWHDQPKTFARWYQLKAPYDNVYVGCDPLDGMTRHDASTFHAIVNVSSTACALFEPAGDWQRTYWFPIIEMGRWPLVFLPWLREVLNYHHNQGHKIYLHCHAGAFRSPSTALLWLQSRGHSPEEALDIAREGRDYIYKIWENHGNIPRDKDLAFEVFNRQEREARERGYGTICPESLIHEKGFSLWSEEILSGEPRLIRMRHRYLWFWYEPKWWIKERIRTVRDWLKKTGRIKNYSYTRKHFWSRMEHAEPEGIRQLGDHVWMNGEWVHFRTWGRQPDGKWDYQWHVEKCSRCGGNGAIFDQSLKPGMPGFRTECQECDSTGVKR